MGLRRQISNVVFERAVRKQRGQGIFQGFVGIYLVKVFQSVGKRGVTDVMQQGGDPYAFRQNDDLGFRNLGKFGIF